MLVRESPFLLQIRHVDPDLRDPRATVVREQIVQDFGMLLPPFALHLSAPDVLCAYWAIARELSIGRRVARAKKEAVAAAISTTNSCPYCVDVHTTMLHALGDRVSAMAISVEAHDSIADPDLRAVVAWARATRKPDEPILRQRPFPDEHAAEFIGVAVSYHYINRMVNIFVAGSPFPVANSRTRPFLRRLAGPAFRRLVAREIRVDAPLDQLLLPAPLPNDLGWAKAEPAFADVFGRAAAVFERAGEHALPEQVRQLVAERLAAWRGEDPGLSRAWVDDAIAPLSTPQRPLGRFAMLAAFASYRVDAQVINEARTEPGPAGDEKLVAAAGWASFAAARQIGSWLHAA